jgi:pimeloyl-ACP methyl ester carboxylesterase
LQNIAATTYTDSAILEPLHKGPLRIHGRGQGEPILFVHGLFANAVAWRKVVPLLAESFRCITADWPFGSHSLLMDPEADCSPAGIAATVADAIEALDLDGVTLVGNDGGGCFVSWSPRPARRGWLGWS